MMKISVPRIACLAAACVLVAGVRARAWSGPGHAAVAALAYRGLASNVPLRNRLVDLLRSHPAFAVWKVEFDATHAQLPADVDLGMFLFIRASTWPDDIRNTTDPKLAPFDHPNWHFVDYPLRAPSFASGPSPAPTDDVLFGLKRSLATLADKKATPQQRAAALSWIIHLIGDIHQPLHCATLFNAVFKAPDGDRGGNGFLVFETAAKMQHHETTKLHGFWDARLGNDRPPSPAKAVADAKRLEALHPRAGLSEIMAGTTPAKWSIESRDRCVSDVYKFKGVMLKTNAVLPAGYDANAGKVAMRRIALAGYRLTEALRAAGL